MKNRWQQSLEAAVAAYDTPMPWARGTMRKAMILRREKQATANEASMAEAQQA